MGHAAECGILVHYVDIMTRIPLLLLLLPLLLLQLYCSCSSCPTGLVTWTVQSSTYRWDLMFQLFQTAHASLA